MTRLAPPHLKWRVVRDLGDDVSTLEVIKDEGNFLTSTERHFLLHAELDAWEKDQRVFSRNWRYEIPRDHV